MSTSDNHDTQKTNTLQNLDKAPIPVLERIRQRGRVWGDLCEQYGVNNPEPPWKVNLEGICDALAEENCTLPVLERRWEEDELSQDLYADVPYPERQLLALAHSLIRRGLFDENELARRMEQVDRRLNMVE